MGNYTTDLTLADCEVKTVKESYDLRNIKQSHVDYEATEAVRAFVPVRWTEFQRTNYTRRRTGD